MFSKPSSSGAEPLTFPNKYSAASRGARPYKFKLLLISARTNKLHSRNNRRAIHRAKRPSKVMPDNCAVIPLIIPTSRLANNKITENLYLRVADAQRGNRRFTTSSSPLIIIPTSVAGWQSAYLQLSLLIRPSRFNNLESSNIRRSTWLNWVSWNRAEFIGVNGFVV